MEALAGPPQALFANQTVVHLATADYVVIGVHVALSVAVGLLVSMRQRSSKDYFVAGQSMSGIFIAVSLISGISSGISFLGIPAYTFGDGIGFTFCLLNFPLAMLLSAFTVIPFFHHLGFITAYSYLEARFSRRLRTVASCLFIFRVVVYLSIVLYAPALALNALVGLPIYANILMCGVLATLYTIKGGMVAVIWTDFLQSCLMVVSVILVAIMGTMKVEGGFVGVFHELQNHSRLVDKTFFIPNPTISQDEHPKETFWSMVVGYTVLSLGQLATDQIAVQRYMAAKSVKESRNSALSNGIVQGCFTLLLSYLGWMMFAFYAQSGRTDPVAAGLIEADQLSPYFALTHLPPGMAGVLVAAVVGSTMSVFSGGINAAATCVYVDIITNAMGKTVAPNRVVRTTRWASFGLALVVIGMAFAASAVQGLVKMGVIATSLCSPLLGVFVLGMFFRRVNSLAANVGFGCGLLVVLYLSIANIACGIAPTLAVCDGFLAASHLSVFWFGFVGFVSTVLAGLAALPFGGRPAIHQVQGLTYWTRKQPMDRELQEQFAGSGGLAGPEEAERQKLLN